VNIIGGNREHPEQAERAGGGTPGRRSVLGGLAALPVVLYGVGSAAPALAATATRPGSVPTAVPVKDYYHHPHLTLAESAWPYMRAADGTTVDASVIPERGAPTRVAILSGFIQGWYELIHANGRADRVMWDAGQLPVLFAHGEFGGTDAEPFRSRFYTLALQPMSRNPYTRSTAIL
jgi:hypothetical protein